MYLNMLWICDLKREIILFISVSIKTAAVLGEYNTGESPKLCLIALSDK
jgi:hypothetical protein